MTHEPDIRVEGVGKEYVLGAQGAASFREAVSSFFSRPAGGKRPREPFWALRDVSFELQPGEVLGVIGRNGAGKSTLLKILSRITEPTEGRVLLRGRVGSLLEVGTGFHPDLTGRENVFMNGAILGMRRSEIRKKFDEIVAFAEVEKFIDTPVKRYSSGMYVRLAFAVAAHLEPEILIVDEVLSVGDLAFQRKCLGKMGSVARGGRTVLFVSHNLGTVGQLCSRTIWLDEGRVRMDGPTSDVVNAYLRGKTGTEGTYLSRWERDPAKDLQVVESASVSETGQETTEFHCDEEIVLRLRLVVNKRVPGVYGYLDISRVDGTTVLVSDSFDSPPNPLDSLSPGEHELELRIPKRSIAAGQYTAYLSLTSRSADAFVVDVPGIVARFSVSDTRTSRGDNRLGFLSSLATWSIRT